MRSALFALLCLVQLAVPAHMIWRAEAARNLGRVWRFETAPVDPADLFRGRYVRLAFRETRGPRDPSIALEVGKSAYALLAEDESGFARIVEVRAERPEGDAYFEAVVKSLDPDSAELEFPVERFYLPEEKAKRADRLLADREATVWAELRIHSGRIVVEDLLVEGVPILRATDAPQQSLARPRPQWELTNSSIVLWICSRSSSGSA